MQRYEYRVMPAPRKGEKGRGLKSAEERFAFAMTNLMNKMGVEGWEYQRADALPHDERVGLTGSKTTYQSLLVFRRPLAETPCEFVETTPDPQRLLAKPPEERVEEPAEEPLVARSPAQSLTASLMPKPMLGAARAPSGAAPALGPANPDLAAE
ncbi:DUF4177 domain-containing protein [bacterium]|nr:DUF4177 domain-containing protein [bacterium]